MAQFIGAVKNFSNPPLISAPNSATTTAAIPSRAMRNTPAALLLAALLAGASCTNSSNPTSSDRAACQAAATLLDKQTTTSPAEGQHIVTTALAAHNHRIQQAGQDLRRNADGADQQGVNRSVVELLAACRTLHLAP